MNTVADLAAAHEAISDRELHELRAATATIPTQPEEDAVSIDPASDVPVAPLTRDADAHDSGWRAYACTRR